VFNFNSSVCFFRHHLYLRHSKTSPIKESTKIRFKLGLSLHLSFALLFQIYCPPTQTRIVSNAPMLILAMVSKFFIGFWIGLFRRKGRESSPPIKINGWRVSAVPCRMLPPDHCRSTPQRDHCDATVLQPCDSLRQRSAVLHRSWMLPCAPSSGSLLRSRVFGSSCSVVVN
jgi:hypothetical protein